jgi:Dehydratase family
MATRETYSELRSARWFEPDDFRSFGHRSRAMQMGCDHADWQGKPIIAILNTWSDIGNCHSHFKNRVEEVKRGVLQAGGFPLEIPCISVTENFVKPTTMLYRNLLAIEVEELLRSHPVDGAVLMGGCDKPPQSAHERVQHGSAAATGRAKCWAQARTLSNTGTSAARAIFLPHSGWRSKAVLHAVLALAW